MENENLFSNNEVVENIEDTSIIEETILTNSNNYFIINTFNFLCSSIYKININII